MTDRPNAAGSPKLEVVQATDGHAAEIAEFIRQIWDPAATAESVASARREAAALNVAEPGVPPPTWIALQAGRVLGYVTTIPIRLWDGQNDSPAYWIKGLMVLPEFRSGPIGYLVLKAAVAKLPRTGALAVAPPALRLFQALGYSDLGSIPNWIRPISPARMLQRLDLAGLGLSHLPRWAPGTLRMAQRTGLATVAGWVGGMLVRGSATALRFAAAGIETGPIDPAESGAQLDGLWQTIRPNFPAAVVHDAGYLLHRYPAGSQSPYLWQSARKRGSLVGAAVVRQPRAEGDSRLKGIRVATLADIWYDPDDRASGLALLGAAEKAARNCGADVLLATTSNPALGSLLRRQFYVPLSGNVHFLFRDVTGEGMRFGSRMIDWWLTRGDGQADEVF